MENSPVGKDSNVIDANTEYDHIDIEIFSDVIGNVTSQNSWSKCKSYVGNKKPITVISTKLCDIELFR